MTRQKTSISSYKGRYYRTIGRTVVAGKAVPKKFLLGTDLAAAEVANRRLEELWKSVVRQHEEKVTWLRDFHSRLGELNGITGTDGDSPCCPQNAATLSPLWRCSSKSRRH